MPTVMIGGALGIFAYVSRQRDLRALPAASRTSRARASSTVICGAIAGAGLGFLWFNAYPAEVFMGDVGALALGAALGTIAVIVRQEIVLFIMGGVFVVETLSVMIQVDRRSSSRGKRVFRMAPIHHHYRTQGLEGKPGRRPLLDHHHAARPVRSFHAEAALTMTLRGTQRRRAGTRDHRAFARATPRARGGERARRRHAGDAAIAARLAAVLPDVPARSRDRSRRHVRRAPT